MTPTRAQLTAGFDDLGDDTLVSVTIAAAVLGIGESTLWRRLKEDPDAPQRIILGSRCTRLRTGDIRAYIFKRRRAPAAHGGGVVLA